MRTLFVVNPAAGHGRAGRAWPGLERAAVREHPGSLGRLTTGRGSGAALARRGLEEGFEAVIAVGGDGTLGEVVEGFLSAPEEARAKAVLGTWPAGSGCDFARHLGIGRDEAALLGLLSAPEVRRLDAGLVECSAGAGGRSRRFFHNVAAFGIAGEVALRVEAWGKPLGGTLSYLAASAAELLWASPRLLDLSVDGMAEPRRPLFMVALANTSSFGGGMRVAPGADAEDGLLDMVCVEAMPKWRLLARFPKVYRGAHLREAGVSVRRVRRVSAACEAPVPLNLDGEAAGALPASFEVLPGALPFLCPRRGRGKG